MNTPSEISVLKKTLVVEYTVSPRDLRWARSDVFYTDLGVNSLVLMNESDLPENMMKFNIWFYTRATVKHALEVSLSLLDDENQQCYAVENSLRNSTTETSKVCATVDFSIIQKPAKRFFQGGVLRIQCSVCVGTREASSSLKPSIEDFCSTEKLLKKHLKNMKEAGSLTIKDVLTFVIPERIIKTKAAEASSDIFTYENSDFSLRKLKKRFELCLDRTAQGFSAQNIRIALAVLDKRGNTRYCVEEVTQYTSKVFLSYDKVMEDPGLFFNKDEFHIYCSLQIDTSPKVSEDLTSKPCGSSEASKLTTISSPTVKPAGALSKYPPSENASTTKLVAENSLLSSFKVEDKSDLEKALNEMLHLLKEARMETVVIVYKKTK